MRTALVVASIVAALLAAAPGPPAAAEPRGPVPSPELLLGERIYREGILPSGEPTEAVVQGDVPVDGSAFSCLNCHMRAGLGSVEGGVITTPTTGAFLFRPFENPLDLPMANLVRRRRLFRAPPPRPAYGDASLATAIRFGRDPTGRQFDPIMPRYLLDDRAMGLLVGYLKVLSSELSPGVDGTTLRLATIVGEGVDPREREVMLRYLQSFAKQRSNLVNYFRRSVETGNRSRVRMLSRDLDLEDLRRIELDVWELSGPPDTWRAQLDERLRSRPVFALIGGMVAGEWLPIHRFCEERHLPCLLPFTDLPAVGEPNWYTLYFSKGSWQEGETAARYLLKVAGLPADAPVVQVRRDTLEGRALTEGFRQSWLRLGGTEPAVVTLHEGQQLRTTLLAELTQRLRPRAILLWTGDELVVDADPPAAGGDVPLLVFSGAQLQERLWRLPEAYRPSTLVTYPFRLPQDKRVPRPVRGKPAVVPDLFEERRTATRADALVRLLTDVLVNLKNNYYRDYLFDLVDSMGQQALSASGMGSMGATAVDPGQLSFGPNQRFAAKGCYVVRLGPGTPPQITAVTDWIVH